MSDAEALRLAVSLCDLTSLKGSETPSEIEALCARALAPCVGVPDAETAACPPVAAVCVYPNMVSTVATALRGTSVRVIAASGFPSGGGPLDVRVREVRTAVESGADEVDLVTNRSAFLAGDYKTVYAEIVALKEACGGARMKVILETGELPSYDAIRNAAFIAMLAGADFIKTSTGKTNTSATPPAVLTMADAIRDFQYRFGSRVGIKPAGGIRTAKDAMAYLSLVNETLGPDCLTPDRFRLGASGLLDDLVSELVKHGAGKRVR
ncbi:MAG: deoxyribose-phosphate aldolase [Armatimonadetes bacterium]|nr:deoxyribose-phosphate aldolase [Armatimonadota bacterium]